MISDTLGSVILAKISPRIGDDDRAEKRVAARSAGRNERRGEKTDRAERIPARQRRDVARRDYLNKYSWSLTNSLDGTPPRIHPLTAAPST